MSDSTDSVGILLYCDHCKKNLGEIKKGIIASKTKLICSECFVELEEQLNQIKRMLAGGIAVDEHSFTVRVGHN